MTLRQQKPVFWPPVGLSDALDGTDDFKGACALLANLIPAPNNGGMMIARPAAVQIPSGALPDYGGGPVTALLTVGNIAYGMYASAMYPGKDRPFAYNMATGAFAPIAGLSSGNLPATQPATGDWTPPTAAAVGSRILFTHPGFPGGANVMFLPDYPGSAVFYGNTANGSPTLTGNMNSTLGQVAGLPPIGALLLGTGIPPNATVMAAAIASVGTTASGSITGTTITVGSAAGIFIGMAVAADGASGVVTNIAGTTITLSNANYANMTSVAAQFIGTTVTMSANATASANNVHIVAGLTGGSIKFGWLDTSDLSATIQTSPLVNSLIIAGGFSPQALGLQPGMMLAGPGIPAGAVIVTCGDVVVTGTGTTTSGQSNVAIASGGLALANYPLDYGFNVAGAGIAIGTILVTSAGPDQSNAYTLGISQPATASGTAALTFSGGFIQMSAPATSSPSPPAMITITGGTSANPLWSSGDTAVNPLAAVPVFVEQFTNRAYFGVNITNPTLGGVTASDSAAPCRVSQANQIITFSDGVPVTAAAGLGLANQLGGIIQSLMVFQGASNIRQITGDFALGTWSENSLQTATGTLAPNSIASTPKGLLFAAPDGLRLIDFNANISEPIGTRGTGIVIPFINAVTSSRAAAAYNENVYRITLTWQPPRLLQLIYGAEQRTDEFWFHLDIQKFSGPHTSTMDLIAPWQSQNSFICAPSFGRGALWRSDTLQSAASSYLENAAPLFWTLRTVLLPDDPSMFANSLTESSVFASMSAATQWLASIIDDQGQTLDQAYVWLGPNVTQSQLPVYWRDSIVFRQAAFQLIGNSEPQTLIGTIELRYQKLKYQITFRPMSEFVLDQSILGGPDVLGP